MSQKNMSIKDSILDSKKNPATSFVMSRFLKDGFPKYKFYEHEKFENIQEVHDFLRSINKSAKK